jgi:hypothetical protein
MRVFISNRAAISFNGSMKFDATATRILSWADTAIVKLNIMQDAKMIDRIMHIIALIKISLHSLKRCISFRAV